MTTGAVCFSEVVRHNDRAILDRPGAYVILGASSRALTIFPSATGEGPLRTNFYHRVFQPALRRAHIENFRWHVRHTFASRLVMRGADLRSVKS